jgi:hypothetical protein
MDPTEQKTFLSLRMITEKTQFLNLCLLNSLEFFPESKHNLIQNAKMAPSFVWKSVLLFLVVTSQGSNKAGHSRCLQILKHRQGTLNK